VSEEEKIRAEDVEAHKRRVSANEEPKAEGESDDDVEAHKKKAVQASDEPKAEGEGDDDVELHRRLKAQ
jgi:hypothetical protein